MFDYDEIEEIVETTGNWKDKQPGNDEIAAAFGKLDKEAADAQVGKSTEEVLDRGLKAMVRRRAAGVPKAPIAVVIMPGNPQIQGYHAGLPLPMAVEDALAGAGFPTVRYDWSGVGMNKHSRGGETTQEEDINFEDSCVFLDRAKELGKRVCIVVWNYSGTSGGGMVTPGHKWHRPEVCALISLSFACEQWKLTAKSGAPFAKEIAEAVRDDLENHANVTVPAIYIFGSKDRWTPAEEVQRIISGRPDGGEGAKMHIVDQSDQKLHGPQYFAMHQKEKEVGITCVEWLKDVYAKSLVTN